MKIKIAALTLWALLAASIFSTGPVAAAPIVSVAPPATTVAVGDTFTLDIDIAAVADLYAFQFDLSFDPNIVNAIGAAEGLFLKGGGATFFIGGDADNGVGLFVNTADTLLTAIAGVSGGGTLASVTFKAVGAGISNISLGNILLLNSSLALIASTPLGGSVTVTAVAVPEPTGAWLFAIGLLGLLSMRGVRANRDARF